MDVFQLTSIGSYPYDDLVKGWEYVRDHFDFIDTDHSVAAGASYGGFMMNWIQGSSLGRKFKALVSHDGTFVADAKVSTDELWFTEHDVCDLALPSATDAYISRSSMAHSGAIETITVAGIHLPPSVFSSLPRRS